MAVKRGGGGPGEERRARLRLEISREASRLFWEQGVGATSGDQIARAVGVSTRTVWRYFRSKESCAEPIVMHRVVELFRVLGRWPRECSLEEHLASELDGPDRWMAPVDLADEMLAVRMIRLAESEPALRTAWLMACDQTEHELRLIIGDRLGRPPQDAEVRRHAAVSAAVVRVLGEQTGAAVLAGNDAGEVHDVTCSSRRLAHAIRTATGGLIGDPIT
ncbi:helix-turn-helix domain-containing protein [Streptomyces sp. NPDC006645]|uniref:TetR/AcrR family transcriptional regulator n=1 Tax=unclassified Streptomyces TaxID=2593676 RepID=UPI0033A38E21